MSPSDRKPQMILHVGAPKCGSSALQTALSRSPDLKGAGGTRYRYTSAKHVAGKWRLLYGARLSRAARLSVYGYTSWPDLAKSPDTPELFAAMHTVLRRGRRRGHVPILSSEAWISRVDAFADILKDMGHPPVDVVVFLRPVVDWMNAAFWQWGIWHTPNLDVWLKHSNMPYNFAEDIAAWAAIPNVRVRVRGQRPDVVAKFADLYGLPLQDASTSNASTSAALMGFLLRNRRFRPDGHAGSVEFVVQRWCPAVSGRKLWSVLARHVHQLRPVRDQVLQALRPVLEAEDMQDLLKDEGWHHEVQYHPDIQEGVTTLDDSERLAALHLALSSGVKAAAAGAGVPVPCTATGPEDKTSVEAWDDAICPVLETLLELDAQVRRQTIPAWQRRLLSYSPLRDIL